MRLHGIRAKIKKKFKANTPTSRARFPGIPNLVNKVFTAPGPNRLWVADITYIWTRQGWLYLAAVLDVYSRRIVGWAVGPRPTTDLARMALERALGRRGAHEGLIHHSDQGSQYANHEFQAVLKQNGLLPSMGQRGDCYDNAMMESFFHTLKIEHVYWRLYQSRDEAEKSLFEFIELFYNSERLHSGLAYKSPAEFEKEKSAT
jgi:transposase InsO family protein